MNTATRVFDARGFRMNATDVWQISRHGLVIAILSLMLIISAFGVIYLKDLNRRLFIHYQNAQQTEQNYTVQYSKLLLEQSAWSTQARVQRIAQTKLNMIVPSAKNVVMVEYN